MIFHQDKKCLIRNFRLINPTPQLFCHDEASTSQLLHHPITGEIIKFLKKSIGGRVRFLRISTSGFKCTSTVHKRSPLATRHRTSYWDFGETDLKNMITSFP